MERPPLAAGLGRCAALCTAAAALLALLALLGAAFGATPLRKVSPGLAPADRAAAVGVLAASAALGLVLRDGISRRRRAVGLGFAIFVIALGATLLAALAGWDGGVTHRILRLGAAVDVVPPDTAACLLFLGLAIVLLDVGPPERPFPVHLLLTLVASLGLLTLLGHAYSVVPFSHSPSPQPMAVNSAVSFVLLALAAACARPRRGFLAVVTSTTLGGVLARQLLPAAIAIPLALSWLRLAGQQARLFGAEFGVALTAVATVLLMTYVVALATQALDRVERERCRAEDEVRTLNASLAESMGIVRERTLLLEEANTFLGDANAELQRLASADGLTGLANRRAFEERLDLEWSRAKRSRQPVSLLFFDVDDFKAYNDLYGHPAGDECLKGVARAVGAFARRSPDLAARHGGEEFALLLPETPREGALLLAEELRKSVESLGILHEGSRAARSVTVSVGSVTVVPWPSGEARALVDAADQALYRAKQAGRNRVEEGTVGSA